MLTRTACRDSKTVVKNWHAGARKKKTYCNFKFHCMYQILNAVFTILVILVINTDALYKSCFSLRCSHIPGIFCIMNEFLFNTPTVVMCLYNCLPIVRYGYFSNTKHGQLWDLPRRRLLYPPFFFLFSFMDFHISICV